MTVTSPAIGDIDLATVASFREALLEAVDSANEPDVVIDCSRLEFISTAGYHALVDANVYALARGHRLVLSRVRVPHARLLRLCDDQSELTIEDDVDVRN